MNKMFSEINIGSLNIKNRIVMPPMVTFDYLEEDGLVTEEHIKHYEERAKGGVGLIIVEATCVNSKGRLSNKQLRVWSDEYIEGLSKIAEVCHKYGAKVLVQIHHAGLETPKSASEDIVAPSAYEGKSNFDGRDVSARALTIDEIHSLQKDFLEAAVRVKKAGFDGIELHGAHSYLISQFFSPLANKREDSYGGSLINRTRFAVEIIEKIRENLGTDFIIGCRMGCNEPDLETSIKIAQELEKAGADLINVSSGFVAPTGIAPSDVPEVPEAFNYNFIVYGGTEIKKNVSIPVIVINDIKTPEQANCLIENDLTDFVALGRALLVDAEWVNKAGKNEKINLCLGCKFCAWFKSGKACAGIRVQGKNI